MSDGNYGSQLEDPMLCFQISNIPAAFNIERLRGAGCWIKLDEFLSRLPTGKPYHTDGLWGRDRDGNEYFGVTAECDGLTAVKPDAYMHRCEIEEIFIPDALLEQGLFLNIPW